MWVNGDVQLTGSNVANPAEQLQATLVKDGSGKGVIRTVDAAPVAYDTATDSKKVQIIAGADDLGLAEFYENANQWYLNDRMTKGLTGGFEPLLDFPVDLVNHSRLVYGGNDYIYAVVGEYNLGFYRYSIKEDSWLKMANMPATTVGIALVYTGGDYIYAVQGNGTTAFWRYSISGNVWEVMAASPSAFNFGGAALVYDGADSIYALCGNGATTFMRYSISGNTWATLAPATNSIFPGSNLVFTDNPDIIYATVGSAGATNNKKLLKYTISTNLWSALADLPDIAGGSLTYSGGDFLYATRAMGTRTVWRYSISTNTWSTMIQSPTEIIGNVGGMMAYGGRGYLYGFRGNGFKTFWRVPFVWNKWQPWMR